MCIRDRSKDPQVWKQFKEDSRKENLVFCVEFIDEDMSSTVFVDLAREFDSIPFVGVQVGQGVQGSFDDVSLHFDLKILHYCVCHRFARTLEVWNPHLPLWSYTLVKKTFIVSNLKESKRLGRV